LQFLSFFLLLLLLQKASSAAAAAASPAVCQLVIEQSKLVCLIAVSICHSNCLRPERKLKTRFNTHMHQSINLLFGFLKKNSDSTPYSSGNSVLVLLIVRGTARERKSTF
jgi:hypothetical protein